MCLLYCFFIAFSSLVFYRHHKVFFFIPFSSQIVLVLCQHFIVFCLAFLLTSPITTNAKNNKRNYVALPPSIFIIFLCVCVFFFILLLLTTSYLIAFISQCTQQIEWWKKMEISLNNNK